MSFLLRATAILLVFVSLQGLAEGDASAGQTKTAICAACHGMAFADEQDGRPGLKAAYHGQCMDCHREMGIENPASTDCIKCHKKRS